MLEELVCSMWPCWSLLHMSVNAHNNLRLIHVPLLLLLLGP